MATETRYLYNDEDLSAFGNQVKEIVVEALAARGKITKEESTAFLERYAVVVVRKGWLGSMIDKALNFHDEKVKKIVIFDRGE